MLFLALVFGISVARAPNQTHAIEVSLVKLFTPHPKPVRAPPPAQKALARIQPPVAKPAAQPSPAPPVRALPANGPVVDPRLAAAEAVRGALQAMVRCSHPDDFNMGPAEREACAQHIHDLRAGAPTYAIGPHLPPPVASHGMTVVSHLSPRPGNDLGPLDMGPVRGVSH